METSNSETDENKKQRVLGIFSAIEKESERGRLLLLSAHIDEVLCKILKTFLKPPRKARDDKLFNVMGPLSTFASRIEMAYRLGLISRDAADCYDILRNIRNECAHKIQPYSFDTSGKQAFTDFKKLSYRISGISDTLEYCGLIGDRTSENGFMLLVMIHVSVLEAHLNCIKEAPAMFPVVFPSLADQKPHLTKHGGITPNQV
jgi:hypothetical protein